MFAKYGKLFFAYFRKNFYSFCWLYNYFKVMRKYYTHIVLICLGLVLYFMANFQRVAVPGAVFDILKTNLGFSASAITALGSAFMYSYAISLLFCGILIDRYGAVKVILCGSLLFSLGTLLFPNTTDINVMYLSRIFMGAGSATFYLSLIQEAKKCFPDKFFGISVSLMLLTGYLGGVFANAPYIYLTRFFDWNLILNFMGIVTIIITLLFCFERGFLHHIPVNNNVKFSLEPFKEVLSKSSNRTLFAFAALNYGLYYVIQTVLGTKFLKDFVNLSDTQASFALSMMIVVAGLSGFILASLSTIFNNKRVIFMKIICIFSCCVFITILSCLVMNYKTPFIAILLTSLAIGGGISSLLVPIIHATNIYEVRSTAMSVMNSCFFVTVGIFSSLVGILLDLFTPVVNSYGNYIYSQQSYILVFSVFLFFAFIEMFFVFRLKDN